VEGRQKANYRGNVNQVSFHAKEFMTAMLSMTPREVWPLWAMLYVSAFPRDVEIAVQWRSVVRRFSIFHLRQKSLVRGTVLVLGSLIVGLRISGFPDVHMCLWLILPFLIACAATWDTARCLQRRWSFYHGGVLLLLYVDLMVILMITFLLLAPFAHVLY